MPTMPVVLVIELRSSPPDNLFLDIDSVVKVVQCPVMLDVY